MKKFLISMVACFSLASVAQANSLFEQTRAATVKITNNQETSGGSGTILKSYKTKSLILTNAHVCTLLVNGGKVITTKNTKYQARKYATSSEHDLCLVEVMADLGVTTWLAYDAPKVGDSIRVSGHPYLFPQLNVPGFMGDTMDVDIITEVRPCTQVEFQNNPIMCIMAGMPTITSYETRVISSMIAPGNSGSGVYDDSGNLVGVVFAGRGRGYSSGIIVPYEYVRNFLENEFPTLKWNSAKTSFNYAELKTKTYSGKKFNNKYNGTKRKDMIFLEVYSKEMDKTYDNLQKFLDEIR